MLHYCITKDPPQKSVCMKVCMTALIFFAMNTLRPTHENGIVDKVKVKKKLIWMNE